MKHRSIKTILTLCLLIVLMLPAQALAADPPEVSSDAVVLADLDTGVVYYEKNGDEKAYPASTTKLMTALIVMDAVEAGDVTLDDEVTATENMDFDLAEDGSSAGIQVGETMSLEDLLYCILLPSANEGCNVVAEYVAGSVPAFVERMNEKAEALGCEGTHFANAHGLPDEEHYTTALDYIKIAREFSKNEKLMEIAGTATYTVPETNMSDERELSNSNGLINPYSSYGSDYVYEYATGLKTGFTYDAGYCLVSTASHDDINLVCAVFGGFQGVNEDGWYVLTNFDDTINLYDWIYDNFEYKDVLTKKEVVKTIPVEIGKEESLDLVPETSIEALIDKDVDVASLDRTIEIYDDLGSVDAPIEAGQELGEITISDGERDYGTVKLVAKNEVKKSTLKWIWRGIRRFEARLAGKILTVLLGLLILLFIVRQINHYRYRKKRGYRSSNSSRNGLFGRLFKRRDKYSAYSGSDQKYRSNFTKRKNRNRHG